MVHSVVVREVVIASFLVLEWLSSGCRELPRSRPPSQPAPPLPAFATGAVREMSVSPHAGNRAISRILANVAREWDDAAVSAILVMNAEHPGQVLAWIAVNWQPSSASPSFDARDGKRVLACLLESVENWCSPVIEVSADAAGREVVACACFPDWRVKPPKPLRYQRVMRSPSGMPQFSVQVIAHPPDHEWIGQKGLALYILEGRQKTPVPVPMSSSSAQ